MKRFSLILLVAFAVISARSGDFDSYPDTKNPDKMPIVAADDTDFTFYIPGFLPWGDGTVGVRGIEVGTQFGGDILLKNLDMLALGGIEGRKGKFGFILEGLYLDVGVSGNTPGRLLNTAAISLEQTIAEATGTYRFHESERGFVELLAGARLYSLGNSLDLSVNPAGVAAFSNDLSQRIIGLTVAAVRQRVDQSLPGILAGLPAAASDIGGGDINRLEERVEDQLGGIWPLLERRLESELGSGGSDFGSNLSDHPLVRKRVREYLEARLQDRIEQRRAAASAAVAAARSAARNRAQRALAKAEKRLASAINSRVRSALSRGNISGSKTWVDPIVGVRGQWLLTDDFWLVARADYGGFGVSSESTYNLYGAIGTRVKENITMELGIRSMGVDYRRGGFVYDMSLTGPFLGTKIEF